MARALYDGRALDCFMAVRELHDFTLRSTISTLANEYGVEIARRNKSVPGHLDSTVTCVEYTITDAGRVRLGELLDGQP